MTHQIHQLNVLEWFQQHRQLSSSRNVGSSYVYLPCKKWAAKTSLFYLVPAISFFNPFVRFWKCQRTGWRSLNVQPERCRCEKELQSDLYNSPVIRILLMTTKCQLLATQERNCIDQPSENCTGFQHCFIMLNWILAHSSLKRFAIERWTPTVALTCPLHFVWILTDLSKLRRSLKPVA